jgi:transglutaminase-like putative cysteine protease
MQIRLGYELNYSFPQPTPMILALSIHFSRASDLITPDYLIADQPVRIGGYRDLFGNWCTRLIAPGGRIRIKTDALIRDSGQPDPVVPGAQQHAVEDLPEDALVFLLGSRYCETDLLSQAAWDTFGNTPPGWARVQAICDYVHNRIDFDYQQARATRTAWGALNERTGVCRDYAHLAVAFCRCMNIPARYCTGYLGDMGTPKPWAPGDFAAWFEAYLGGAWHIFDPRNNTPRIGRVLLARGRDASDVAIATTFGYNTLESFKVWTDEVTESAAALR